MRVHVGADEEATFRSFQRDLIEEVAIQQIVGTYDAASRRLVMNGQWIV